MVENSSIPVFILAGGMGTRISEETHLRPKPMIEIGDTPILLHIMRLYYAAGFNDFVICAGYKAWEIKQYFLNYEFRHNHAVIDHRKSLSAPPSILGISNSQERWRVRVVDTGISAMTGARIARAFDLVDTLEPIEHFAATYGDGLCDVDLSAELLFHLEHGHIGTVLGVPPLARFGELHVAPTNKVERFQEKPQSMQGLINGGFFFFHRRMRPYLSDDSSCVLEREPLSTLADSGELMVYKHMGFWHAMDTLRDKLELQRLLDSGRAPWLVKHS